MTRRRYRLAELLTAFKGLEAALAPPPPPQPRKPPPRRAASFASGRSPFDRMMAYGRKVAQGTAEGTRHDSFKYLAAKCAATELTRAETEMVLQEARDNLSDPVGFPWSEVHALAAWAHSSAFKAEGASRDGKRVTPLTDRPAQSKRPASRRLRRWRRLMGVNS